MTQTNNKTRRRLLKAAIRQAKKCKRVVYIVEKIDTRRDRYYHLAIRPDIRAVAEVQPGDKFSDHSDYLS